MAETIECPSGLTGEARGLKTKELNLLANRRMSKSRVQVDKILSACWINTLDPGPYDFGEAIDWGKVLQGDRFYALLKIRALSLGNTYAFGVTCQQSTCRNQFEWEVDLDSLPARKLSPESREAFCNGNRFETVLPAAGTRVWFRLAVGSDERRFAQILSQNPDRIYSTLLALRVLEIEGVKPSDKLAAIEDMEIADGEHLRAEFDRVDCGVDTTIEIECPECWAVQEVDLPFDQRFLLGTQKTHSLSSPR